MNRALRRRRDKLAKKKPPGHPGNSSTSNELNLASRHHQPGTAPWQQSKTGQATEVFQNAQHLEPEDPEILLRLGLALGQKGRLDEAIASLERALRLRPVFFEALFNLGNLFLATNRFDAAVDCYRRSLRVRSQSAEAYSNLGSALMKRGQLEEARDSYHRALEIRPNESIILTNLGTVLHKLGQSDQAIATYRQALAVTPDLPDTLLNLGHAAHESNRLEDAEKSYQRALEIAPNYPEAMTGLGIVAHKKGEFNTALDWYQHALSHRPDMALAHYNEGLTRLLLGDLPTGWEKYERRWQTDGFKAHGFAQPLWSTATPVRQTVLLHCEQGFGDSIQFIRYAPLVKSLGYTVAVLSPPPLERLLRTVKGIDHLASHSDRLPPWDCQAPMLSLPHLLGTTLSTIPSPSPYLFAEEALTIPFKESLDGQPGLKVGVAWRGNPTHVNDRNRSIDARVFARLCRVAGCRFINLQKDIRPDELAIFSNVAFLDWTPQIKDFADTAALISQLDLVISVDTAVAHLAGAMGCRGWILLPQIPDWRWLWQRSDSPWYPSLQLFRQHENEGWEAVITRVADQLEKMTAMGAETQVGKDQLSNG